VSEHGEYEPHLLTITSPIRQVMVRGIKKVDRLFVMTMAAHNLVRMRTLGQVRPVAG
jgi:hypothetical protein